jgi:hypothetical protein
MYKVYRIKKRKTSNVFEVAIWRRRRKRKGIFLSLLLCFGPLFLALLNERGSGICCCNLPLSKMRVN